MRWRVFVIFILAWTLTSPGVMAAQQSPVQPTVLLVSIDGFRWDYPERTTMPNLTRLIQDGVRAKGLIPVFPAKTFPNHYSIVTGLYPENHGIVANGMFDPKFGAYFSLNDRQAVNDGRWWQGLPLWSLVRSQGKIAATFFWPGSEAEIAGYRPNYWSAYDGSIPNHQRIDQVLEWLDLPPARRPSLICFYFSFLDSAGHKFGPESAQVEQALQRVDRLLGRLLTGLEQHSLLDKVNLVLTSDHGMETMSPERVIFLDDYVDLGRIEVVDWSPAAALRPAADYLVETVDKLKNAHPRLKVFAREEIPRRFHYRRHRRICPLIAIADPGWMISSRSRFERSKGDFSYGSHGFDNLAQSMQGLFVAHGPAFRQGLVIEPFLNIHIYPLIAHILGLPIENIDGDLEVLNPVLAHR